MRAVIISNTTRPPTPTLAKIIQLDIPGDNSSTDEVGSRVCKPPTIAFVGLIPDTGLDLSETGIFKQDEDPRGGSD